MDDNKKIKEFETSGNLDIEKIINTYNNYIYKVIKNAITNPEDIEEIISDVFIILWKKYEYLDKETKIKPYLIGITKNLIKKKYQKYGEYKVKNIEELEAEIISDMDIANLAEDDEKIKLLANITNNMKEEEKQIFMLFYYQNKKVKDIAKNLNISSSKVKVTLFRLRNLVKKKFRERGYNYGK